MERVWRVDVQRRFKEIKRVGENQVHAGFRDFCQVSRAFALEEIWCDFAAVENGREQARIAGRSWSCRIKLGGFAHSGGLT